MLTSFANSDLTGSKPPRKSKFGFGSQDPSQGSWDPRQTDGTRPSGRNASMLHRPNSRTDKGGPRAHFQSESLNLEPSGPGPAPTAIRPPLIRGMLSSHWPRLNKCPAGLAKTGRSSHRRYQKVLKKVSKRTDTPRLMSTNTNFLHLLSF